jgi:hypothetical protein
LQIAIEIRVEPETRADRAIRVGAQLGLAATDGPSWAACHEIHSHEAVAGEAAPRLELRPQPDSIARHSQQIAPLAAAKSRDEFWEQSGRERLPAGFKLDRHGT